MIRAVPEPMTDNIVVMPGLCSVELPALYTAAGEFGWEAEVGGDLRAVAAAQACRKTVAVLLHRSAFGLGYSWLEAIRMCRLRLPEARVIVCHGLSESIDWPALSRAGAFHALSLPLKENELRQSLGFVWEGEERLATSAERLLEAAPAVRSRATRRPAPGRSGGFYAPRVNCAPV